MVAVLCRYYIYNGIRAIPDRGCPCFLPVSQPFCIKMHVFLKKVREKFGGIEKM